MPFTYPETDRFPHPTIMTSELSNRWRPPHVNYSISVLGSVAREFRSFEVELPPSRMEA